MTKRDALAMEIARAMATHDGYTIPAGTQLDQLEAPEAYRMMADAALAMGLSPSCPHCGGECGGQDEVWCFDLTAIPEDDTLVVTTCEGGRRYVNKGRFASRDLADQGRRHNRWQPYDRPAREGE